MARLSEENNVVKESLLEKIIEIAETIEEEFGMIELIEGKIQEVLGCDLDCKTCTEDEKSECMINFKKLNLYWLRKIVQDEAYLKKMATDMIEMKNNIVELAKVLKISIKKARSSVDYEQRAEENNKRLKATNGNTLSYYS